MLPAVNGLKKASNSDDKNYYKNSFQIDYSGINHGLLFIKIVPPEHPYLKKSINSANSELTSQTVFLNLIYLSI